MNPKIKLVEELVVGKNNLPEFSPGDNITVSYKITEGNKERIQEFRGDVIMIKGVGASKTFTVRKLSNGVGVERTFPMASPFIAEIEVNKKGRVRRAKLFYQRARTGKKSRIQEKRLANETATA